MNIELDFMAVLSHWPLLLKGILWTLCLTGFAAVFGVAIGIACAWIQMYGKKWMSWPVLLYIELIRNTPLLIQLFFIFFGLPAAGVRLSVETSSIIAVSVNLGAYAAEIIRAGLGGVPRGQIEAATSLALNRMQTFLHVVLPPALKNIWPSLINQIVLVMLGTSVCSQISSEELNYAANLIQSRNFRGLEAFTIAAATYLLLSVIVRRLLQRLGPVIFFRK